MSAAEAKAAAVPESVLWKRKREEQLAADNKEKALADRKKALESRKTIFARAKQYAEEYDAQGPQYVCTNFSTFIYTNCSGIYREFSHRVKSVSMAKFTSQEVSAFQEGGNERAKEIYFKH